MRRIWDSVVFRKILIIFTVGLVSRSVVNTFFDVNVFKDYTMLISLIYYVSMACFTGFLGELSHISFNVFDIGFVRNSIESFYVNGALSGNKVPMGMSSNNVDKSSGLDKDNSIYCARRHSAAVVGLYGRKGVEVGTDYVTKHSTGNKLRCKLL